MERTAAVRFRASKIQSERILTIRYRLEVQSSVEKEEVVNTARSQKRSIYTGSTGFPRTFVAVEGSVSVRLPNREREREVRRKFLSLFVSFKFLDGHGFLSTIFFFNLCADEELRF